MNNSPHTNPMQNDMQQEQMQQELKKMVSELLTKDARSRLANIRTVKPQLASQVEMYILQLQQAGQIRGQVDDAQLKQLLQALQGSDSPNVKFRHE